MKNYRNTFLKKFMDNKIILESMSMDLLRVALGLYRGSVKMADRFSNEALARKNEVNTATIRPYLKNVLTKIEISLKTSNSEIKAEDALMYSIIVQNYCHKFLHYGKDSVSSFK